MAKPKRIVLLRHGNSQANADKGVRATIPDHEIELTEQGWEQAKVAGLQLNKLFGKETVRVYLSPYRRTRQTYEGVKLGDGYEMNIISEYEDPRIREQDFGHLRNLDAFELIDKERSRFGTFFYRIPDGESGADCYDRVSDFLNTLHRDFTKTDYPDNALIISHGLTIRLFCMRWFHWSVEEFERLRNPFNCEQIILELQPNDKYKLMTPFRKYSCEETKAFRGVDIEESTNVRRPCMQ